MEPAPILCYLIRTSGTSWNSAPHLHEAPDERSSHDCHSERHIGRAGCKPCIPHKSNCNVRGLVKSTDIKLPEILKPHTGFSRKKQSRDPFCTNIPLEQECPHESRPCAHHDSLFISETCLAAQQHALANLWKRSWKSSKASIHGSGSYLQHTTGGV